MRAFFMVRTQWRPATDFYDEKARATAQCRSLKPEWHFFIQPLGVLCRGIAVNVPHFSAANMNGNWRGRWRGPSTRAFA